jgi:hypothetical protein
MQKYKQHKFPEDAPARFMLRKIRVYDNTLRHEAISAAKLLKTFPCHFSLRLSSKTSFHFGVSQCHKRTPNILLVK